MLTAPRVDLEEEGHPLGEQVLRSVHHVLQPEHRVARAQSGRAADRLEHLELESIAAAAVAQLA